MAQTILPTDLFINGNLAAKTFTPPAGSIPDAAIQGNAGILASKQQHQYEPVYSQPGGNNAAVERKVLHRVQGLTGTVVDFRVGARVAATGNATATIDLVKNGTTILSSTITLDSTTAAYATKQPAGYTSTSLAQGDVLEVNVSAVNAGTGALAQGLFAQLVVREDAQ